MSDLADLARSPAQIGSTSIGAWCGEPFDLPPDGTTFLVAVEACKLGTSHGCHDIAASAYAAVPGAARVHGGRGLAITAGLHCGLFTVGGPLEHQGRLRYIDGCTATVLIPPIVLGDPCLHLLWLPPGIVQTDHDHPSLRAGVVLSGEGRCVLADGGHPLHPGTVFVLPERTTHRFESGRAGLRIVAWHPDSESGPSDDDHPMLNRTLKPSTDERIR